MLATIERIENVESHPNADMLDIVVVRGYRCIVQKGVWHIGDICVLIQPDTVLPDVEWAAFYKKSSSRVKAVRLRGEWSFGIVENPERLGVSEYGVGTEVGEILGIIKYESQDLLPNLDAKTNRLPFGMPKTNEKRFQNIRHLPFGKRVVVTLKIDGQSATYYYNNGEFGLTTRRFELKPESSNNKYTEHIRRYDLENKLRSYCEKYKVNLALRGESYGQGIQRSKYNPHSQMKNQIAFFGVWLIDKRRYTSPFEQHSVYNVCREIGLPTVPILEETILTQELIDKYRDMDKLNGKHFEGVVIAGKGFSFKVINMEYDSRK